ncbi:MAG TPA: HAD family phosphatase [Candidatus Paceibacterota bacterium]|nr:HAD family phosphatase [Candidatus Paceibacterota bacterium]
MVNTRIKEPQAVLFDMDGLMVESEPLHFEAYKRVLGEWGHTLELETYFLFWGSDIDMSERMARAFNTVISHEEICMRKNAVFREVFIHQVTAQKGLLKLLKRLQENRYLLAVVSSSQLSDIETILKAINAAAFFTEIISAEAVENGKPAPDCYLRAAEKLNVAPSRCLVLEDSPRGVLAAKRAGMKCYAIPSRGFEEADFDAADKIVKSLDEVWTLLKERDKSHVSRDDML